MIATRVASIAAPLLLVFSAAPAAAQTSQGTSLSLSPQAVTPRSYTVDVENRYSNVGAAIIDVGPNDFKIPEGIRATASGTLIHPQVFLTAGHFTAPGEFPVPPFFKVYVTFGTNALDRSKWIPVSAHKTHPSLPPCQPPVGCTFLGGDPLITDVGLLFFDKPVPNVKPADLSFPERLLDKNKAAGTPMTTVGYGFPDSVPGGGSPSYLLWDGLRKYRSSKLAHVLAPEWASWELPGSVCFGDSGGPTFFDRVPGKPDKPIIVAVASDGGDVCFTKDVRARVDTYEVQRWISDTIRQKLGVDVSLEGGDR